MPEGKTKPKDDGCPFCGSRRGYGTDSSSTETFPRCLDCGAAKPVGTMMQEVIGRMKRLLR